MVAAGIEAWREAQLDCLPEADVVMQIYLAMYGEAISGQYLEEPGYLQ